MLSSLRASSFLLSAAAEHFPAEHEAMRLMSPICDSLSHPLPGGQRCLCLHGLNVVREERTFGLAGPYPALLCGACGTEEPPEHPPPQRMALSLLGCHLLA